MSFVFMGTPEFSTIVLDHLEEAGFLPALTVTQPDRPCGRGQRYQASPVGRWSEQRGIPALKPRNSRAPELAEALEELAPEYLVTASFGQILPARVLQIPRLGCLNVHASLLPRYRGASPIQSAILAGDKETGISIMQMDQGLDTGPVLVRESLVIPEDINASQLSLELAHLGGRLLGRIIPSFLAGELTPQPQDPELATITRLLQKSDGEIDFSLPARDVHNHIRGMNDWPGAFAFLNQRRYKVIKARVYEGPPLLGEAGKLHVTGRRMIVSCGEGALELLEIQPQSGTAMSCSICSHNFTDGSVFDPCSRLDPELDG